MDEGTNDSLFLVSDRAPVELTGRITLTPRCGLKVEI